MSWGFANIDWDRTAEPLAAWVQAGGTILAIYWAGRLSRQQGKREREERAHRAKEAVRDRRNAMVSCRMSFEMAAHYLRGAKITNSQPIQIPNEIGRRINAAEAAVNYYLSVPEPVPHQLVAALTLTAQLFAEYRGLRDFGAIRAYEDAQRIALIVQFMAAADAIREVIEQFDLAEP